MDFQKQKPVQKPFRKEINYSNALIWTENAIKEVIDKQTSAFAYFCRSTK